MRNRKEHELPPADITVLFLVTLIAAFTAIVIHAVTGMNIVTEVIATIAAAGFYVIGIGFWVLLGVAGLWVLVLNLRDKYSKQKERASLKKAP